MKSLLHGEINLILKVYFILPKISIEKSQRYCNLRAILSLYIYIYIFIYIYKTLLPFLQTLKYIQQLNNVS